MEKKSFTWRELKEKLNTVADEHLDSQVIMWGEETGYVVEALDVLSEDYRVTDEGLCGESDLRSSMEPDYDMSNFDEDHPVVLQKGAPVLIEKS